MASLNQILTRGRTVCRAPGASQTRIFVGANPLLQKALDHEKERLAAVLGTGEYALQDIQRRIRVLQPGRRESKAEHFGVVANALLRRQDWLTARRELWEARLDQFDKYVKQLKKTESKS